MNSNRNDGHSCLRWRSVRWQECFNYATRVALTNGSAHSHTHTHTYRDPHTYRVQVNAVIHMHFDCIRQTSCQTRQAGFDVTDRPSVYTAPVSFHEGLYIARFPELKYSILGSARLQAQFWRKNARVPRAFLRERNIDENLVRGKRKVSRAWKKIKLLRRF